MNKRIWLVMIVLGLLTCGCGKNYEEEIANLGKRIEVIESRLSPLETQIADISQKQEALKESPGRVDAGKKEASVAGSVDSLSNEGIQAALKNAGFYSGPVDGKIGPNSEKAIKAFQKENGLTPDGVVGAKTRSLLIKHLNNETE